MTLRTRLRPALPFVLVLALAACQSTAPPQPASGPMPSRATSTADVGALAQQIVGTADVQPGELVFVYGGQHTTPLLEAIMIASNRRGGRTLAVYDTDAAQRAFWTDVPEEYLTQRIPFADVAELADVYIGLPSLEDPTVLDDIPEDRFALRQAQNAALQREIMGYKFRGVFVSDPTEAEAADVRLPYAEYARQHRAALAADYDAIARSAQRVASALQGADRIRVTTPAGTDLAFGTGRYEPRLNDGRISDAERASGGVLSRFVNLPGGSVEIAGVETSAEGRVVVPKADCRGGLLRDVRFRFAGGRMTGFEAGQGADCFEAVMAPYSGPKDRFGFLSVGLNPGRSVVEADGAEYRPSDAAGMVYLVVGDNAYLGGANKGTASYGFPLTNATVEADGEVIVRDGRLVGM